MSLAAAEPSKAVHVYPGHSIVLYCSPVALPLPVQHRPPGYGRAGTDGALAAALRRQLEGAGRASAWPRTLFWSTMSVITNSLP
jgi:hypothetical protein